MRLIRGLAELVVLPEWGLPVLALGPEPVSARLALESGLVLAWVAPVRERRVLG